MCETGGRFGESHRTIPLEPHSQTMANGEVPRRWILVFVALALLVGLGAIVLVGGSLTGVPA